MGLRSGKWLVTKYDGLQKVWERELKANRFTTLQISDLLQKLACTELTAEEAMDSLDPATDVRHLAVRSDGVSFYSCGENPYYTAQHVD